LALERRRLAAILVADVVGYSKLVSSDELGTLSKLAAMKRDLIEATISKYSGRLFKSLGDGFLVEFASAVQAVACAVAMQKAGPALPLRIGIHVGDVVVQGDDLMGDGVNVAARVEGVADPGGIAISRAVHEQVRDKLDLGFIDKGEIELKNIARPVQVFNIADKEAPQPADSPLTLPDKPSIAVLPFLNMSGDPDQEFFGDGISEDIITALSRVRGFFVIARNSSFTYKGSSFDIRQVGRELGVCYVLEGSVRRSGNRLRVTAQLNNAATGAHIWAERYDRELADIFTVQDEIVEAVVASIEPQLLLAEERRSERKAPSDLGSWECVTRAFSHFSRFTAPDYFAALALLKQAIDRNPQYARALSLFALSKAMAAYQGWSAERSISLGEAKEAVRKAEALDRDDPWVHYAAGMIGIMVQEYGEAAASLVRATELNPNFALAHGSLGRALAGLGHFEEALDHIARAMRISPRDPNKHLFLHWKAISLFLASRYEESAECAKAAIRERPDLTGSHRVLVASLALTGKVERARAALRDFQDIQPDVTLKLVAATVSMQDAQRVRLLEGLRLAGLSE